MAGTKKRLEAESTISETARNAGVEMTIRVVAYSKTGIVEVDGTPMSQHRLPDGRYDEADGWVGAQVMIAQKMELLRNAAWNRRNFD